MSTWIRADADFGDPVMRLTLDCRGKLGQQFRDLLSARTAINSTEAMTLLCPAITEFIETYRPDLRGLVLLRMSSPSYNAQFEFLVAHPRLPRQVPGAEIPSERLETCWTCGKPLPSDGRRWLRDIRDGNYQRPVEVCSETCMTAQKSPPQCQFETFVENGKLLMRDKFSSKTVETGIPGAKFELEDDVLGPGVLHIAVPIEEKQPTTFAEVLASNVEIQWEDDPRSGISKRLLEKVLIAGAKEEIRKKLRLPPVGECDKLIANQTVSTFGRCSVCNFPLAEDSGAVGDKCSVHKA